MATLAFETVFEAELNADCVEYSPALDCIALGTYQLDPETGRKAGKLYFFKGDLAEPAGATDTDAILDVKFDTHGQHLYVASNQRGVAFVDPLTHRTQYACDHSEEVFLALSVGGSSILASTDKGSVKAYTRDTLQLESGFKAHELELWSVARDGQGLVYTGADDGLFKIWSSEHDLIHVNKTHGAGVCTIAASHSRPNMVVTGSYDKAIRLWDNRSIKSPLLVKYVASGVWRLVWNDNMLLAACMHDGFHVLDENLRPVDQRATSSLAYGCCWGPSGKVLGCSFYDKRAYQWSVNV